MIRYITAHLKGLQEAQMNKGQILESYFNLKEQADAIAKQMEALRSQVKEIGDCKAGGFQSFIDEQERRSVSLVDIQKSAPDVYEVLCKKHLVKQNKVLIVKVKRVAK